MSGTPPGEAESEARQRNEEYHPRYAPPPVQTPVPVHAPEVFVLTKAEIDKLIQDAIRAATPKEVPTVPRGEERMRKDKAPVVEEEQPARRRLFPEVQEGIRPEPGIAQVPRSWHRAEGPSKARSRVDHDTRSEEAESTSVPSRREQQGRNRRSPGRGASHRPTPPRDRFDLDEKERMELEQYRKEKVREEEILKIKSPFTEEIAAVAPTPGFRLPKLPQYDGTTDPEVHQNQFESIMRMARQTPSVNCQAFQTTLTGRAQEWFVSLPPGSIGSYKELWDKFQCRFASKRRPRKTTNQIMAMRQGADEPLRMFMDRFNEAAADESDLTVKMLCSILIQALRPGPFILALARQPPRTPDELLQLQRQYFEVDELATNQRRSKGEKDKKEGGDRPKKSRHDRDRRSSPRKFDNYTPLNRPRAEALMQIAGSGQLRWPRPMKESVGRRRSHKYCRFHKDVGHDTEDCIQLREEIERLI